MSRQALVLAGVVATLLLPAAASAHPAAAAHEHGLETGLLHPLTGLDHLLVMLAIGAWAVRAAPREIWFAPSFFVAGMTAGLLGGFSFVSAVNVELFVALSVVAVGLLLTFAVRLPRGTTMFLAASAGLAHGAAHAAEGPAHFGLTGFAMGALMTTLMLHAVGAFAGLAARRLDHKISRIGGAAMTIFGLHIALGSA